MTPKLTVPYDAELERDVLAALAREGDARPAFAELSPDDFHELWYVFEALRTAYDAGTLHCRLADDADVLAGRLYRFEGVPADVDHLVNRLCAGAGVVGLHAALERLHELSAKRAQMRAAMELFNAIGVGDDEDTARALEHLRGSAA